MEKIFKEYIDFLNKSNEDAIIHGYKFPQEVIQKGKIRELEQRRNNPRKTV